MQNRHGSKEVLSPISAQEMKLRPEATMKGGVDLTGVYQSQEAVNRESTKVLGEIDRIIGLLAVSPVRTASRS